MPNIPLFCVGDVVKHILWTTYYFVSRRPHTVNITYNVNVSIILLMAEEQYEVPNY